MVLGRANDEHEKEDDDDDDEEEDDDILISILLTCGVQRCRLENNMVRVRRGDCLTKNEEL